VLPPETFDMTSGATFEKRFDCMKPELTLLSLSFTVVREGRYSNLTSASFYLSLYVCLTTLRLYFLIRQMHTLEEGYTQLIKTFTNIKFCAPCFVPGFPVLTIYVIQEQFNFDVR